MHHLINKTLIVLAAFGLALYSSDITTTNTILFLLSIITSMITNVIMNESTADTVSEALYKNLIIITQLIIAAFTIGCIISPVMFCFVGIVLYDCHRYNFKYNAALIGIACLAQLVVNSTPATIIAIVIGVFAVVLAARTKSLEELEIKLLTLRDKSTENELVMKHNNELIRRNQDDAINMATLKERNRIAREIHDNVGHMLTRSILQVGALKVINKDEKLNEHFDNLSETLNTAMTGIRQSVHDLHDESIDLKASIENILAELEGFTTTLDYDAGNYIPKDIKYAFITIVKEATNNTVKHSNGDKINVLVREHPGFYQLMVEDNGSNIEITNSGIGLTNMKDRVEALGGTFKFSTDNGFNILISVMKNK